MQIKNILHLIGREYKYKCDHALRKSLSISKIVLYFDDLAKCFYKFLGNEISILSPSMNFKVYNITKDFS